MSPGPAATSSTARPGVGVEQLDEPLGDGAGRLPDDRPAALPAARDGTPGVELGLTRVVRHPRPAAQKAGMISVP